MVVPAGSRELGKKGHGFRLANAARGCVQAQHRETLEHKGLMSQKRLLYLIFLLEAHSAHQRSDVPRVGQSLNKCEFGGPPGF